VSPLIQRMSHLVESYSPCPIGSTREHLTKLTALAALTQTNIFCDIEASSFLASDLKPSFCFLIFFPHFCLNLFFITKCFPSPSALPSSNAAPHLPMPPENMVVMAESSPLSSDLAPTPYRTRTSAPLPASQSRHSMLSRHSPTPLCKTLTPSCSRRLPPMPSIMIRGY